MNALAQSPLFWGALIAGLLVVYLLPSLIGTIRQVEGLGWLVAFNVLVPGVGWLAGMILACTLPRREPPVAYPPRATTRRRPASTGNCQGQTGTWSGIAGRLVRGAPASAAAVPGLAVTACSLIKVPGQRQRFVLQLPSHK